MMESVTPSTPSLAGHDDQKPADDALIQSETRYRNVIDHAPFGMHFYMLQPDGRLIFTGANPAADTMLGMSHDPLIGLDIETAFPGLVGTDVPGHYRRVAVEGGTWHTDQVIYAAGVIQGAFSVTAFQTLPGSMVAVFYDITEQKRMEEALRESEERFRLLFHGHDAPFLLVEPDSGQIVDANSSAARFYGYSQQELTQMKITQINILPPEQVRAERMDALRRGSKYLIFPHRLKNGEVRTVEVYSTAVKLGGKAMLFSIIHDITERRLAEEKIKQFNLELEQRVRERTAALEAANKELEAFAYSVSHDLRAPLRGIDGWSHVLLEDYGDVLDEQAHHYLGRVRAETQRMGQLIDDLLVLSRISRAELRSSQVDITALAEAIAARLREAEPERRFEWLIQPGLTAQGDPALLEIALTNLLGNAVKFTQRRPLARIEVGQVQQDGAGVYFVRDNGVGFDMAHAKKLFGAFQRLHRLDEFPGTGIGLATVQRIVQRHGGKIWAEAAVDRGATFFFTLEGKA